MAVTSAVAPQGNVPVQAVMTAVKMEQQRAQVMQWLEGIVDAKLASRGVVQSTAPSEGPGKGFKRPRDPVISSSDFSSLDNEQVPRKRKQKSCYLEMQSFKSQKYQGSKAAKSKAAVVC